MFLCAATCSFVFCRQRQDERLRRGGEQKSVIVLSEQPYSSALIPLAQYAGPLYFNNGESALEEVSHMCCCYVPISTVQTVQASGLSSSKCRLYVKAALLRLGIMCSVAPRAATTPSHGRLPQNLQSQCSARHCQLAACAHSS